MRIIINIDPIKENGKHMRIRTRYNTSNKDGKQNLRVLNAMVDFYGQIVDCIKRGHDETVADFVDEGEKA